MAKFFDSISGELKEFMRAQHVFFVATACPSGRINLSPKGIDTFRCLSEKQVGYLDLTGSGNETAGHLLHDGRMTVMFCSFEKEPRILRLYGLGRSIKPYDKDWPDYLAHFAQQPGQRQIILLDVESVQTSCGFSIPLMEYRSDRKMLNEWATKKGPQGLANYWRERNQTTIDGRPTHLINRQPQE